MKRLSFLVLLFSGMQACGSRDHKTMLLESERRLILPKDAGTLSSYDRYYAVIGRSVRGTFIRSQDGNGDIQIVRAESDLPFVADGGCGVIQVRLDLRSEKWDRPFCHGL